MSTRKSSGPKRMRELGMKRITIYVGETTHKGLSQIARHLGLPLATFVRGCAISFERGGKEHSRIVTRYLR